MTAPKSRSGHNDEPAWPNGRWISPREDTPATVLYAGGLSLIAVGTWLHGRLGVGFSDPPPAYGGSQWLIVALLCLASICGFSCAYRRLRSRGLDTTQIWGVVRPLHDAKARSYERRQVARGSVVFGLLGGLFAGLAMLFSFVLGFDQWLDTGYGRILVPAFASILGVLGGFRIRRRITAQYSYGRVPYDVAAFAVNYTSAILLLAAVWIAGRTGVPTTSTGGVSMGSLLLVLSIGGSLFFVGVLRLRIVSRPEVPGTSTTAGSPEAEEPVRVW